VAEQVAVGNVVGWFQGRMEWGPPRSRQPFHSRHPGLPNMKDVLNARIKHREWFRPFAPSILADYQHEYFEHDHPSPFMLHVYKIRPEKRKLLSAVNHVDDTGRLQTVTREENPLYYDLISAFHRKTGIPVILNTSFNENEPIVCTPEEPSTAFSARAWTFSRFGPFLVTKSKAEDEPRDDCSSPCRSIPPPSSAHLGGRHSYASRDYDLLRTRISPGEIPSDNQKWESVASFHPAYWRRLTVRTKLECAHCA